MSAVAIDVKSDVHIVDGSFVSPYVLECIVDEDDVF